MPFNKETIEALVTAAETLLAARDRQMITPAAWSALRRSVHAYRRFQAALDRWSIVDDRLVCRVRRRTQRCSFRSYLAVAAAIDKLGGRNFLVSDLRRRQKLTAAGVRVALDFLLLHGCIQRRGGRRYAATTTDTYIGAMVAWNALLQSSEHIAP